MIFLNLSELIELDAKGCKFTWSSNPRNGVIIREKLDRILINWPWRRNIPHAMSVALPAVSSDHSPLLLIPDRIIEVVALSTSRFSGLNMMSVTE